MVGDLRRAGARVVVLGPVPAPARDVPVSLSAELTDTPACEVRIGRGSLPWQTGVDQPGLAAERATVRSAGGRFVDVLPWFCAGSSCPVIVDNLLAFRDASHLTTAYAAWLAPVMEAALRPGMSEATRGRPPSPVRKPADLAAGVASPGPIGLLGRVMAPERAG